MTSREATSFLPRAGDDQADAHFERSLTDWAWLIGIGAVQWPWLLRSLSGGRQATKHRLLTKLGLPPDALPNLGSWKADTGLLLLVAEHIERERPRTVVEFGPGATTMVVARALERTGGGQHIGYDQHGDFVEATRRWLNEYGLAATLETVPLKAAPGGWPGLWYEPPSIPENIDLMIVDGPPWTIHPLTRGAAETLFDRITPGGTVMLDDAARPGERLIATVWKRRWPDFDWHLSSRGTKGTLIGRRSA